MQKKLKEIVYVPVAKVIRDEEQPRKYFDPFKLGRLSESIKQMGIREPLTVEALPDGTYKIVDGERRWRAAQSIGLKEVPAIIETKITPVERIVEQFHLQELREGWQPDEKAIAIKTLADSLGVKFMEAARMVGLSKKLGETYQAMMSLNNKDLFLASGLPVDIAQNIRGVLKTAQNQTVRQLSGEMDEEEESALEAKIINDLVSGDIKNAAQLRDLKDAIVKDADNIKRYMKGASAVQLFKKSDASGTRAYRRFKNAINNITIIISVASKSELAVELVAEDKRLQSAIKGVIKSLTRLLPAE